MLSFLPHLLHEQHFLLSSGRCIFWEEERSLILSDLHIGKSGHFRKHGIAVPQAMMVEDLQRLFAHIQFFKPKELIIVGDMFHSHSNKEHDMFLKWRMDIPSLRFHLVMGNHDILHKNWYESAGIETHRHGYEKHGFSFVHDINDCDLSDGNYCFSGHIHPAVIMRGIAKQAISLPCFYFGNKYAVLPAFGKFTGTYPVSPNDGESVYVLAENKVIEL